MAAWDVVSQAAAPEFEDRWAPIAEEVAQDPWAPVSQAPAKPQGRGVWTRIKEGASAGFGAEPTGPSEKTLDDPRFPLREHWLLRSILGAGDTVLRAPGGAIGAAAGAGAGLAEAAGMSSSNADRLMRDLGVMGQGALLETGQVRPRAGEPLKPKAAEAPKEINPAHSLTPETIVDPTPIAEEPALAHPEPTPQQMSSVKFAKTVGGARAHPTDAAEWKPVVETPVPTAEPLEKITSAATKFNDKIYEGVTHADAYKKYIDETKGTDESAAAAYRGDGFITSTGRFVGREEAQKIAEGTSQVPVNTGKKPGQLYAEELKTVQEPALAHPEPTPQQMSSAKSAARVIQNILIPDEVSPMAESAAADIRSAGGRAARDTETTRAALDAESRKVSALPDAEKLGLIDYIENRSKEGAEVRVDLKPVADAVKTAMDARRAKLEALDSTEKAHFVEDYYTHLWKDPEAAARVFSGPSKEGSGRFLKERSIPTVAEGIARGLEPVSINPLEVTLQYAQNMDRFIASSEVIDKALKDGNAKYYTPGEQPPGWVEINTRRSKGPFYAPKDWARVYNNFVDRGIHRNADWGKIYDGARNTSNAITSLELGLSGFHAATMAQEAMVNAVARGIGEIASGKPVSALKSLVKAPIAPIADTLRGRKLEQTYLNKSKGTPLMQEITDLLTEAGGRGKGARHAPDYQYSQAGSYWDSFKRGSVGLELRAADAEYAGKGLVGTGGVAIKQTFREVGRVLQTVAKPLFEYTIPKMKNGAFYENMASWMEANPIADHATQVKAARKIWDSVDNRFGEVVQDNIFWNKTLKQSLQVALRSYSWTFGTIQEIGGGAKDLIRHPTSLSPKSKHYSPKAAYVIALPIAYATVNAVYQKLKTGKDPESVSDVMRGGLSGGTQPGVGGRGTVPERTMMPGYMKDVFGWYHHPVQELSNKIATGPRMVKESLTNKDWKDQPIRNPNAPYPEQVREYFKYVYQSLGPISVKQLLKGNKEGSNISTGETLLGLRPTPSFLQDPEGYDKMKKGISERDWQKKERYDKRQQRQYGGP